MYVRQAYRYKCGVAERAVSDLVSRLAFAPFGDGIVCALCPQVRFAHPRLGMVRPLRGRWLCVSACRVCLPVLSPPYTIYVFTAMPACHAEGCGAAPRCLTAGERREPADAGCTPPGVGLRRSPMPVCGVWMEIRPLRGRDSVCPLSAGSLRSPAVRHSSASPRPCVCACHPQLYIYYIRSFPDGLCILCAGCAHPLCAPGAAPSPEGANRIPHLSLFLKKLPRKWYPNHQSAVIEVKECLCRHAPRVLADGHRTPIRACARNPR